MPPTMKAAAYFRYGPPEVVSVKDVAKPTPREKEVLIRIHATTVTAGDWRVRSLILPKGFGPLGRLVFGLSGPRRHILGTELAGVVEAVGRDVGRFRAGDEVIAYCGMDMGCHAEYKCLPEDAAIARKPSNLDFGEAAALSFGGATALTFLKRAGLRAGESVLVNGASGSVGTAAVRLASHFGAEVTAVCSGANAELARSLGAVQVIDYTREDFTRNGKTYDIILDAAGTAPFSRSRGSLNEKGRLLLVVAGLPEMLGIPWVNRFSGKRVIAGPVSERAEDLRFLAGLAEAGEFRPVIDSRFTLDRIVDAHRRVDSGRKRGNVVVTVAPETATP